MAIAFSRLLALSILMTPALAGCGGAEQEEGSETSAAADEGEAEGEESIGDEALENEPSAGEGEAEAEGEGEAAE